MLVGCVTSTPPQHWYSYSAITSSYICSMYVYYSRIWRLFLVTAQPLIRLTVNTFTIMLMFMQYVYIQWTLRIAVHALTSGAVCKSLFLSKVVSLYNYIGQFFLQQMFWVKIINATTVKQISLSNNNVYYVQEPYTHSSSFTVSHSQHS